MSDFTPAQKTALAAVDEVLAAHSELAPPTEGWIASEWVLVVSWFNPETGKSHMTRLNAEHMLAHHRTGLLHEAIKDDWDGPEDYEP